MTGAGEDPLAAGLTLLATQLTGAPGEEPGMTVDRSTVDDGDDFPEDEPFEATIGRSAYRPSATSEAEVTRECLAWLAVQPQCAARKAHGGAESGGAEPDLDICWRGRACKIELKAPGGSRRPRPTQAQHQRLLEWQSAGALVGWASDLVELQAILELADDPHWYYNGQRGGEPPVPRPEET